MGDEIQIVQGFLSQVRLYICVCGSTLKSTELQLETRPRIPILSDMSFFKSTTRPPLPPGPKGLPLIGVRLFLYLCMTLAIAYYTPHRMFWTCLVKVNGLHSQNGGEPTVGALLHLTSTTIRYLFCRWDMFCDAHGPTYDNRQLCRHYGTTG